MSEDYDKNGKAYQFGRLLGRTVVKGGKMASVGASAAAQKGAVKARARKVVRQLEEQLDAGAISDEEFVLRVESVVMKAGLDMGAMDEELEIKMDRIRRRHK